MATADKTLKSITDNDKLGRYFLPYCYIKMEHPNYKHVYLPVNRNYKPLGIQSKDHVKYEDYSDQYVVFAKNPADYTGIWYGETSENDKQLFLYNDGLTSRKDYFERLFRVMNYGVLLSSKKKA